jgi:hypothetical protein
MPQMTGLPIGERLQQDRNVDVGANRSRPRLLRKNTENASLESSRSNSEYVSYPDWMIESCPEIYRLITVGCHLRFTANTCPLLSC